uniref:Uncharacterized protein n=1 Tax=Polytomella parva TaxID=51329 RepID=A0A7S0VD64_9CHLO
MDGKADGITASRMTKTNNPIPHSTSSAANIDRTSTSTLSVSASEEAAAAAIKALLPSEPHTFVQMYGMNFTDLYDKISYLALEVASLREDVNATKSAALVISTRAENLKMKMGRVEPSILSSLSTRTVAAAAAAAAATATTTTVVTTPVKASYLQSPKPFIGSSAPSTPGTSRSYEGRGRGGARGEGEGEGWGYSNGSEIRSRREDGEVTMALLELSSAMQMMANEVSAIKAAMHSVEETRNDSKDSCKISQDAWESLQSEISSLKVSYTTNVADLKDFRSMLDFQLRELDRRKESIADELETRISTEVDLGLKEKEREIFEALKAFFLAENKDESALVSLSSQVGGFQENIMELQKKLDVQLLALLEMIESLKVESSGINASVKSELIFLQSQFHSLQSEHKSFQAELEPLKSDSVIVKTNLKELSQAIDSLKGLPNLLSQLNDKISSLMSEKFCLLMSKFFEAQRLTVERCDEQVSVITLLLDSAQTNSASIDNIRSELDELASRIDTMAFHEEEGNREEEGKKEEEWKGRTVLTFDLLGKFHDSNESITQD